MGDRLHPILVVVSFGLLIGAVLADVAYLVTQVDAFAAISLWAITAGTGGGLFLVALAARDWALASSRLASRTALIDMLGDVTVLSLFALGWGARVTNGAEPDTVAYLFSFGAIALGALL